MFGQYAVQNRGANVVSDDDRLLHPLGHDHLRARLGQTTQDAADLAHAGATRRGMRLARGLGARGALDRTVDQRIVAARLKAADAAQDGRGVTARLARQRPDRFALLDMAQVKTQIAIPRIVAGGGLVLVSGAIAGRDANAGWQSGKRGVQGEISRQNCHDHSFAS